MNFGHVVLNQEIEYLATWQSLNVLLYLLEDFRGNAPVPIWLVILAHTQLCMRIDQQIRDSTAEILVSCCQARKEKGKALTLCTSAMVLESLCSTYPNSPVNESLSEATVDFIVLLRLNNGLMGSSLSAVSGNWVLWSAGVFSAWWFSTMDACESCN